MNNVNNGFLLPLQESVKLVPLDLLIHRAVMGELKCVF